MLSLGQSAHQVKSSHLNLLGTCLPFSSLPDKNLPVFLDWHCFQDFHFLFFPIYLFLYLDILVVMCVGIDFLTLLLFGNSWIVWMCMLIFTIHFGKFQPYPFISRSFSSMYQFILKSQWHPDFSDTGLAFHPFSVSQWFTLFN